MILQYIHAHFFICSLQSGKYPESLELTKVALKDEEKELGSRPERTGPNTKNEPEELGHTQIIVKLTCTVLIFAAYNQESTQNPLN